jgi:hypothetical protein
MYTPVKIHQLSPTQQRKLSKGDKVIIRKGSGQEIYLSDEQLKKFDKASQKGSGLTIRFDPYQQDEFIQSGSGIRDVFRKVAKIGQKALRNKAKEAVERAKPKLRELGRKALPRITELAKSEGRRAIDKAVVRADKKLGPNQFTGRMRATAEDYLDRGVDYGAMRISKELEEPVQNAYAENEDGEFEMEGEGFKDFVRSVKKAKIGKKLVGFVKDQKIGKRLTGAIVDRAIKTIAGAGTEKRPRGRPKKGGALRPAGY